MKFHWFTLCLLAMLYLGACNHEAKNTKSSSRPTQPSCGEKPQPGKCPTPGEADGAKKITDPAEIGEKEDEETNSALDYLKGITESGTASEGETGFGGGGADDLSSLLGGGFGGLGETGDSTSSSTAAPDFLINPDPISPKGFTSFTLHDFKENYLLGRESGKRDTSMFRCPGDSYMVGQSAAYDRDSADRAYKVACQFYVDSSGLPVKKKNCRTAKAANAATEPMAFSCPGHSFMAGHQSTYQSKSRDRIHRFECCEMWTRDERQVKWVKEGGIRKCDERKPYQPDQNDQSRSGVAAPGVNDQVNNKGGPLRFQCTEKTLIYQVRSDYFEAEGAGFFNYKGKSDRQFSYDCCEFSVGGQVPPPPPQNSNPFGF